MAKVCEKHANEIYITDDNPRRENPKLIRQMIISGFKKKEKVQDIPLRSKAITTAIINSKPNGIILISGKGHEITQTYKNKTLNFSDKAIIKGVDTHQLKYNEKNYNKILNAKIISKLVKKKNIKFEGSDIIPTINENLSKNKAHRSFNYRFL